MFFITVSVDTEVDAWVTDVLLWTLRALKSRNDGCTGFSHLASADPLPLVRRGPASGSKLMWQVLKA